MYTLLTMQKNKIQDCVRISSYSLEGGGVGKGIEHMCQKMQKAGWVFSARFNNIKIRTKKPDKIKQLLKNVSNQKLTFISVQGIFSCKPMYECK